MKVLIVTGLTPDSPSGVVTYYKMLEQDLKDQGIDARVIDSSGTPVIWHKFLGLIKRIMGMWGSVGTAYYYEFADFASMYLTMLLNKIEMPDIIHAQDAKSGVATYLALGRKLPIVMTCHFNDDPVSEVVNHFSLNHKTKKNLESWYKYLFCHVRSFVFVSNYAYEKSKHLLSDSVNKTTIYNTVNYQTVMNNVSDGVTDKLIISNVGYIDERKNQKLLILIGYELRRRGIFNFEIWFIGDRPKRPEYEQLAISLELTGQVNFYGQQVDPWRLVEQTDLYIHTALNDNCPYSIIEAFAVKTPVLALPVGGIPEMLPEHFGLLYGTNVESLADEIITYFDPIKRAQLKLEQALYADQHFNHRKSLTKLISFYHQTEQAA